MVATHHTLTAEERGAAAVRRGRRVLRRARLVPVEEAVHRRRGGRARRGQRALLRRRAGPRACRCARRSWPTGSRRRAPCSGTTTTSTTSTTAIGRDPAQAADRRGRRPAGPGRRDPGVPVHADLQAADLRRADATSCPGTSTSTTGRPRTSERDADRVHPVPRLRRGDGHHHHGRRQPPLEGDRRATTPSVRHFAERDRGRAGGDAGRERRLQRRADPQGPDGDPQGTHELPPLPHLPRQRRQRQRPPPPGDLAAPAGRRQRLPGVPALRRHPRRVQPRRAGPPHPRRAARTTPTPSTARSSGATAPSRRG